MGFAFAGYSVAVMGFVNGEQDGWIGASVMGVHLSAAYLYHILSQNGLRGILVAVWSKAAKGSFSGILQTNIETRKQATTF